jgi:hypothetical protein
MDPGSLAQSWCFNLSVLVPKKEASLMGRHTYIRDRNEARSHLTKDCGWNKSHLSWAPVAHTCNLNYLGGRNQEDHPSKPPWTNSSRDPVSEKPKAQTGLLESLKWYSACLARPLSLNPNTTKRERKNYLWSWVPPLSYSSYQKNSGITIILTCDGETGILSPLDCVLVTLFSNKSVN